MSLTAQHEEDKAFARALHGNQVKVGLVSNLVSKNKDLHDAATQDYLSLWKKPEQEFNEENKESEKDRLDNYTRLTNAYYNLATDFYEYGWGTSFHFSRYYKGEEFFRALARHEHYLAAQMGIKKHFKVLDVGCGVGGPAREIAQFTGAHITGFNNNAYQLQRAQQYAEIAGLHNQWTGIKGNFMEMPFEGPQFDAVYAIEATVHAPKLEGVYGEIFRVLKPGCVFGCYEWCMTESYDEKNPEHRRIAHGIEIGNGIPKMFKSSDVLAALENVGFEIVTSEDLADVGDAIDWYYPLAGDLRQAQSFRDIATMLVMTKFGRAVTTNLCRLLEMVGLAPAGTVNVQGVLETAADALVEGGKLKLFTPMFFFVARKPSN